MRILFILFFIITGCTCGDIFYEIRRDGVTFSPFILPPNSCRDLKDTLNQWTTTSIPTGQLEITDDGQQQSSSLICNFYEPILQIFNDVNDTPENLGISFDIDEWTFNLDRSLESGSGFSGRTTTIGPIVVTGGPSSTTDIVGSFNNNINEDIASSVFLNTEINEYLSHSDSKFEISLSYSVLDSNSGFEITHSSFSFTFVIDHTIRIYPPLPNSKETEIEVNSNGPKINGIGIYELGTQLTSISCKFTTISTENNEFEVEFISPIIESSNLLICPMTTLQPKINDILNISIGFSNDENENELNWTPSIYYTIVNDSSNNENTNDLIRIVLIFTIIIGSSLILLSIVFLIIPKYLMNNNNNNLLKNSDSSMTINSLSANTNNNNNNNSKENNFNSNNNEDNDNNTNNNRVTMLTMRKSTFQNLGINPSKDTKVRESTGSALELASTDSGFVDATNFTELDFQNPSNNGGTNSSPVKLRKVSGSGNGARTRSRGRSRSRSRSRDRFATSDRGPKKIMPRNRSRSGERRRRKPKVEHNE